MVSQGTMCFYMRTECLRTSVKFGGSYICIKDEYLELLFVSAYLFLKK